MLEVIRIVQLHILVCLPKFDDSHFNKMATIPSLLPLFQEGAHTLALIKHSIDVVRNAVQHLNPGQTPVLNCDQPLFTLAKHIQWKWPDTYGEDKLVVMFGGVAY